MTSPDTESPGTVSANATVSHVHTPCVWLCADVPSPAARPFVSARLSAVTRETPCVVWVRPHADTTAADIVAFCDAIRAASHSLVLGDRADLCLATQAAGLHLPAHGLALGQARAYLRAVGADALPISGSVHDAWQIEQLSNPRHGDLTAGVQTLVISPVFATPEKGQPLGAGGFAALRAMAPNIRAMALGGITTAESAMACAHAGASGVVLRRAWLSETNPALAVSRIAEAFLTASAQYAVSAVAER